MISKSMFWCDCLLFKQPQIHAGLIATGHVAKIICQKLCLTGLTTHRRNSKGTKGGEIYHLQGNRAFFEKYGISITSIFAHVF